MKSLFSAILFFPLILAQNYENVIDFDTVDKDGDNFVSMAEFQKWFSTSRLSGDPQRLFHSHDLNSDGRLIISEFVPLAFALNRRPDLEGSAFFKRLDADKDGILTRTELQRSPDQLGPEIIEGLFTVADTNADGKITHSEFERIADAFDPSFNVKSRNIGIAHSLLDSMDSNRDRRLSRSEVFTFVNQFNRVSEQTVGAAFAQLDSNSDGFLSVAELQTLPQRIIDLAGFQQMPTVVQ